MAIRAKKPRGTLRLFVGGDHLIFKVLKATTAQSTQRI
jgi:hypothetical protein